MAIPTTRTTHASLVPDPPPPTQQAEPTRERYQDEGLLGRGGMAEVHQVFDHQLNRIVAMKILHSVDGVESAWRFSREAKVTARLQHPGIPPVYDRGYLEDGRQFITMKLVDGQTLMEMMRPRLRGRPRTGSAAEHIGLRRLIEALVKVCEAVAYAHEVGVVHRDLKPSNIMIGQHGEVLVMDWGIARILGMDEDVTASSQLAERTRSGEILGTPAYMAPEQLLGRLDLIGPSSDVYALGSMLYIILAGQPPYLGKTTIDVLRASLQGPPAPVDEVMGGLPEELVAACKRAMANEPPDRFQTATELADVLIAWLDGAQLRTQALALVDQSEALKSRASALETQAIQLEHEGRTTLIGVPTWAPESDKLPGWAAEDRSAQLKIDAMLASLSAEQLLHAALARVPGLPQAHAGLASWYRLQHHEAETRTEHRALPRLEALLHTHAEALPAEHEDRAQHLAYLKGIGAITLVTDPIGAEVLLERYTVRNRRLVTEPVGHLGRTPLEAVPQAMGSYLLRVQAPNRVELRYPVCLGRQEHWDGVPPGQHSPQAVPLLTADHLGPDDIYVPGGPFWCGGDPQAPNSLSRQRIWIDGFIIGRFPVTNREFLEFLDGLVRTGRESEALRHAPRERGGQHTSLGKLVYGRLPDGRFALTPDSPSRDMELDWPAVMIDWYGALAYTDWLGTQHEQPWRLAYELEREKAGRGVDSRLFSWGDHFDPSRTCMIHSHRGKATPVPIDRFPLDESPYGVRSLCGNSMDWCLDHFETSQASSLPAHFRAGPVDRENTPDTLRVGRGAGWCFLERGSRLAKRDGGLPTNRSTSLGFRVCRSLPRSGPTPHTGHRS